MSREVPRCLPLLSALINNSSVQGPPSPVPVFLSGVRFAANDTPHGPLHAVSVSVVAIVHGLPGAGLNGAVILMSSGCPDSILLMSGSGPFGPIFLVVWQSLQPPAITSVLPRSTSDGWGAAAAGGAGCDDG